ncbi:PELOTA RNA binding domain-containing protein [Jatrophihabitans endophyticus]|uniref:PELOTA RNA binding domain-containing protein n=1 Tax=Jatrophihabitans endophyticus TaxID=1206085 RepID=A0A1M5CE71_9ACTN|nr:phosphoribosyltransferase domain-containing protein [Jatrophihabitans endophyticus]SHF52897.1 PELOTA RNA binding domain-containing protein [Jatrophihabitans endophyticus]
MDGTWDGAWVAERFGVALRTAVGAGRPLPELVGLALRRNPKRAHLLVSTVLGKHVPVDPRTVHGAGVDLGVAVRAVVGTLDVAVLGFAETATGLGHCVAEALGAPYLHSTRRRVATARDLAAFEEAHSHATGHRLLPEDPELLSRAEVVVLVDDELSTGRTARNTIAALHAVSPHRHYVLATLVDLRDAADRSAIADFAATLGVALDVVSLSAGSVEWPADFPSRAAELTARPDRGATCRPGEQTSPRFVVAHGWHAPDGGRHGVTFAQTRAMRAAAARVAAQLAPDLGDDVLVLGTEELMYAPTLIGVELAGQGVPVRVSSTTRSPVMALDESGYPIRSVLSFPSHDEADDGPGTRYAYNVARAEPWSDVVVVVDEDGDTAALRTGLLAQLSATCHRLHVVVLPTRRPLPAPLRGPAFGSYAADEVSWLLTDLSAVVLEAPTEEREEAIQSGGAHYAESLPVEYQPDEAYLRLFETALDASAERIAHAVGVVTEIVLAERGPGVVLASLARAGTPVGVLMRRWAAYRHGVDVPHHAVSIVRGRGIDTVALRWLAAHHDPAQVVFVDGWTGKGAIARELAAALATAAAELGVAFDPALAVLADPGSCVRTFGTREDFLVPSACLNSTVSGLVSRTVLNRRVLAPGTFHGAKFYRELAPADVSHRFLDAVTERFADVTARVDADWPVRQRADRTPTWAGWAEIERISAEYGIGDVTLVKPGVGETTRVLLRRVPWAVLVRAGAAEDLAHVLLLAEQRGVPVHEVPGLTYRCVGLIHPRFTRGATGADGRTAR